jgi:hypothetical protein
MKYAISWLTILMLAVAVAPAATLTLGSAGYQSDQWNANGANIEISRSPNWTSPYNGTAWVSWAQTGNANDPNYIAVAVGTTVTFTHVFNVNGTPTGGTLRLMAADTTDVLLNGVVISNGATTFGADYYGCGDTSGCRFNRELNITISAWQLHSGINKFEFRVKKGMVTAINGQKTGFGVDYLFTVDYTPALCTQ